MSIELPSLLKQPPPRDPEAIRAYLSIVRKGVYRRAIAMMVILLLATFSLLYFANPSNDRLSLIIYAGVVTATWLTVVFSYTILHAKRHLIQVFLHGTPCKSVILQNDLGRRARNMLVELYTEQGLRRGIVYLPILTSGQFNNNSESVAFISDKYFAFFAARPDQDPVPYLGTLL
jgi:hypothetical protein